MNNPEFDNLHLYLEGWDLLLYRAVLLDDAQSTMVPDRAKANIRQLVVITIL